MFDNIDVQTVLEYEKDHVLTPWIVQGGFKPLVVERGEGACFYDSNGKEYLDLTSQFVFSNLGHSCEPVISAISEQAARIPCINSQFTTAPRAVAAKMIADVTPGDLSKVFFSPGGTEAVEGAVKTARIMTGKDKIISRYRAYHGSTYGAMSCSGDFRNWSYEPAVPGSIHCLPPYCYRCPFGVEYPSCDIQCAKHVEDVIRHEGGGRRVAAFIGEPIFGAGGIITPPDEYWPMVREICDKYEVLLIADEVMTGFGRTGKWFGMDHYDVVPDIMTMAKGINSGYVPLGATCIRKWVADKFDATPFLHGHTYSGHAVAMAACAASIETYKKENLIERSAEMGDYLMVKLLELKEKHPSVGDVRGKGLFCGLELVKDRKTREPVHEALQEPPAPPTAKNRVLAKIMEEGVYLMAGAASVLVMAPPLIITRDQIDHAMDVIDRALVITDEEYTG